MLSNGVLVDLGKNIKKSSNNNHHRIDKVILDYVDEMRVVLESQDRDINMNQSGTQLSQINQNFSGPSHVNMSPNPHPGTATTSQLVEDLKCNFAEMVKKLCKMYFSCFKFFNRNIR